MNAIATTPPPNVDQLIASVADRKLTTGQRINTVGDVMRAMSKKMFAALPKHVTPDRMIKVALNCIRKNPRLLDCTPASLFAAIADAATYGWELGSNVLAHAYLVPYGDECVLIPGYKGLIDLCRRSGQVSTISMEVVHEGDKFTYAMGDDPKIEHHPNDRDPQRDKKPITHAYVVVRLRDGGVQRSVWSREKIEAHKEQYSQGWRKAESKKKDSPWHTAWPTMAKKTVIRDMINRGLIPLSAEYRELAERAARFDDEGLDFGTIDMLPPAAIEGHSDGVDDLPPDDIDQTHPDDAGAVNNIADAPARFAATTTHEQVVALAAEYRAVPTMSEAELQQIWHLESEAKNRIRGGKPKQKELT